MAELAGLTFDDLKAKGEALWEKRTWKIYPLLPTVKRKRTFYTSAYHAALHPFIFQDADGQFRGLDKNIESRRIYQLYGILSLGYLPGFASLVQSGAAGSECRYCQFHVGSL